MTRVRAHVLISGRVVGVYFRDSTRRQAEALGLAGWVRNTADDQVEAAFEGEEAEVRKIVAWCHRGPSRAQVEDVTVEWQPETGEFSGFEIRF